jgi:hypothetical protein
MGVFTPIGFVLAVLGMLVGVDGAEHAGGLTDLDELAVGVR